MERAIKVVLNLDDNALREARLEKDFHGRTAARADAGEAPPRRLNRRSRAQ